MTADWTTTKRTKVLVGSFIVSVFLFFLAGKLFYMHHVNCPPHPAVSVDRTLAVADDKDFGRVMGIGMRRHLPSALIIGVQKSGTGALLKMLNMHPDIQISQKEVHFFDQDENYSRGAEWYRRQMPLSYPSQITIEKTPGYCDSEIAPERIAFMKPDMKILVIVREPTTRAISQYVHILLNMQERNIPYDSFEKYAVPEGYVDTNYKCIKRSMYINFLQRWLAIFPRDQIHIVDGDKLITNPAYELKKVETFLGLKQLITEDNFYFNKTRGFYCMINGPTRSCLQKSKGRKHPDVDPMVIDVLHDFFRPFNKRFQEVFNLKFDWP
ncbi:heparan sulfate glucosamine 3-O-sulfotransferase 1-like [Saccoglossus kowalevskii]|uniref:Heparan sulfate glucosamine 3-O-sulfotransferase 5-like n=1 Tax=Saccoglossus kowalevskii TaxID=10224 RepID=A0ABM0GWH3_SACKO|nr:PREDICTED: heparan sulfate glucosamine 3-O-sulfotransferase 5-like [Saccoglossus kowalevskii]